MTNPSAKIISLLPAATEIVAALGAADQLVGITHECDFPPEVNGIARVTTSVVDRDAGSRAIDDDVRTLARAGTPLFAIDAALLRRLAPTVVFTQSLCAVCAVSDGEVHRIAAVLDPAPRIVSLGGTTLDGVWTDFRAVAAALGRTEAGERLIAATLSRMRHVHERLKAARAPRPRVAVIEWLDPLYAAGHWTPELVRRAGGIDALAEPGAHSVRVSMEQVREARPDLLLFAPCGFGVERAEREAAALLDGEAWRWARGIEAWAIDGNALTSRAGPRLADAVEVMASIVAPASFDPPPAASARRLSS